MSVTDKHPETLVPQWIWPIVCVVGVNVVASVEKQRESKDRYKSALPFLSLLSIIFHTDNTDKPLE